MDSNLGQGSKFFFKFFLHEVKILEKSLRPSDIDISLGPEIDVEQTQNVPNQTQMIADSAQKLVMKEESESFMEIPDSDGEAMPDVNYNFNTNKNGNDDLEIGENPKDSLS